MSRERGDAEGEIPFEEAMARLEKVVAALEGGDLPLEASLAQFEQGVRLVRLCSNRLKDAEIRVRQLEETSGELRERPVDVEEE
jgi:exodeoxyribonuclease VII small subunit